MSSPIQELRSKKSSEWVGWSKQEKEVFFQASSKKVMECSAAPGDTDAEAQHASPMY